jgi:plastocyanin
MRRFVLIAALGGVLLLFRATVYAYEAVPVEDGVTITGTVTFDGVAPKPSRLEIGKDKEVCGAHPIFDESLAIGPGGGIANAVVTIKNMSHGKPIDSGKVVIFDQQGCQYTPHVIAFPVGSTVKVINSDGILHSVHTVSSINPVIDMAQPGFKKTIKLKIARPEAIKVTCDAHNWMEGWWFVVGNPYYAVTDRSGHFSLADVPPGAYTLQVWQEKLGTVTRKVNVTAGAPVVANFTMDAKKDRTHADD